MTWAGFSDIVVVTTPGHVGVAWLAETWGLKVEYTEGRGYEDECVVDSRAPVPIAPCDLADLTPAAYFPSCAAMCSQRRWPAAGTWAFHGRLSSAYPSGPWSRCPHCTTSMHGRTTLRRRHRTRRYTPPICTQNRCAWARSASMPIPSRPPRSCRRVDMQGDYRVQPRRWGKKKGVPNPRNTRR